MKPVVIKNSPLSPACCRSGIAMVRLLIWPSSKVKRISRSGCCSSLPPSDRESPWRSGSPHSRASHRPGHRPRRPQRSDRRNRISSRRRRKNTSPLHRPCGSWRRRPRPCRPGCRKRPPSPPRAQTAAHRPRQFLAPPR